MWKNYDIWNVIVTQSKKKRPRIKLHCRTHFKFRDVKNEKKYFKIHQIEIYVNYVFLCIRFYLWSSYTVK